MKQVIFLIVVLILASCSPKIVQVGTNRNELITTNNREIVIDTNLITSHTIKPIIITKCYSEYFKDTILIIENNISKSEIKIRSGKVIEHSLIQKEISIIDSVKFKHTIQVADTTRVIDTKITEVVEVNKLTFIQKLLIYIGLGALALICIKIIVKKVL